jgi:hypothetical protein
MAMFVHLTADSRVQRIRRNGIARLRKPIGTSPGGVYAVPVTRNFYASHQWLRELKRTIRAPSLASTFEFLTKSGSGSVIYGQSHRLFTAAEAIAILTKADDPMGWQVVVLRRVEADEIHKTRQLPQVIGWRFSPKAKGKPPFCTCKFCVGGDYGSAKLRRRLGSPDDEQPPAPTSSSPASPKTPRSC